MKKFAVSLLIALSVLLANSDLRAQQYPKIPKQAMNLKLKDIDNNETSIGAYMGKEPLLLIFWTTWCPYCVREINRLNSKYHDLMNDKIQLLAINMGESADKISRYAKDNMIKFKIVLDKNTKLAYSFEIIGVPTYVLIDKKGNIIINEHSFPENYKDLIPK